MKQMTWRQVVRSMTLLGGFCLAALSVGCEDGETIQSASTPPEEDGGTTQQEVSTTKVTILDTLSFTKVDDKGHAPGFNLDGKISEHGDEATCGKEDLVSPDGEEGIDNQLATLVPLFELAGIGAAEGLIQDTIEGGGLLLMLELTNLDDNQNDDEVTVMVRAGQGVPLLGTDGKVLSGQTFHLHPESPDSVAQGKIENGVLTAGPFEAHLPIVVFGVRYDLTVHNALLRANVTLEGELTDGVFGGGVEVKELITIGEKAAMDDGSVLPAIKSVFGGAPDLVKNSEGACTQVSAALGFTAVSAYYYAGEDGTATMKKELRRAYRWAYGGIVRAYR